MSLVWCCVTGHYCKSLSKTLYLDNRGFLPENNVLRDSTNFAKQSPNPEANTKSLSSTEERELRMEYDQLPSEAARKRFAREHGVKGCYALMDLPYHKFHSHIQPDCMHTIKDVVEHVVDLLIGLKSDEKLHLAENETRTKKRLLDQNITKLTSEEKKLCNDRIKGLDFPAGCSAFKGDVFDKRLLIISGKFLGYLIFMTPGKIK